MFSFSIYDHTLLKNHENLNIFVNEEKSVSMQIFVKIGMNQWRFSVEKKNYDT